MTIDGADYCLTQNLVAQAVYSPCPPPANAAVMGLATVAVLAVLTVAWVIPEIARRRTLYESVILTARRSL
ncbi:MAG: hypothetical protein EA368_12395 [Leptolyngbya sp. DLM2.Bin27]|nr:MAG: hypothetical protein EA368_12395 [Leptolyngbya sp. DLM2.Bin27]